MDVHEDITLPAGPLCAFGPAEQLLLNLCASSKAGRQVLALDPRPYVGLYDAAVNHVDRNLALLHDFLAETGRLERSLLCVTADHGQTLFEGGVFGHSCSRLSEELVHVPLIFTGGLAAGLRDCDAGRAVTTLDLAPTILDLLGVRRPASFLGRSLRQDGQRPICGQSFMDGVRNRVNDATARRYPSDALPAPHQGVRQAADLLQSKRAGSSSATSARTARCCSR